MKSATEGKNCSSGFFLFRVDLDSSLEWLYHPGKPTGSPKSVPCCKMVKKALKYILRTLFHLLIILCTYSQLRYLDVEIQIKLLISQSKIFDTWAWLFKTNDVVS